MSHTIDTAQAALASTATFPSRSHVDPSVLPTLSSQARRLYRVLSHTWRHHRAVYDVFERETLCTARFTALVRRHALLSEEQILIRE